MTGIATKVDSAQQSAGGRLVAVDGRTLPLLGVRIAATAGGGIARTTLTQRFRNPFPDPLRLRYLFPLPHDGAVGGFAFRIGAERVVGEVDTLASARERFEQAIVAGRTAARVEQSRGSVFTQELGNVPPGGEVEAELVIDQRLAWLEETGWEYRFPTALAPRYRGEEPRGEDATEDVAVAGAPLPARLAFSLTVDDPLGGAAGVSSPSHALLARKAERGWEAALADDGGAPLDRDLVVRWRPDVGGLAPSLEDHRAPEGRLAGRRFGLLTIVPPAASPRTLARDLIVLLDTSGSMAGRPFDQARAVVAAILGTLGDADRLELLTFAVGAERWRPAPAPATLANRADALGWLQRRAAAGGGTELRAAIVEALRPLQPSAQRQVVVVTDGEIDGEGAVVAHVLAALPRGSRLHVVGVGSAVNRSLTGPLARAGGGVELILGLAEDPSRVARELAARCAAPVVAGIEVDGSAVVGQARRRLPDLLCGAPALVALELRPEGGTVRVRGTTADGPFEQTRALAPVAPGSGRGAVAALFGREAAEERELEAGPGRDRDAALERIGLDFQLSTRRTTWLAIREEPSVDPTRPTRRVIVPQELPWGMSAIGLGISPASACSGSFTRLYQEARVAPRHPPPPPRNETAVRELEGVVTLVRPDRLVVEVELEEELTIRAKPVVVVGGWGPGPQRLVEAESTAPGDYEEGQVIRLAILPPTGRKWPQTLTALIVTVRLITTTADANLCAVVVVLG